MSKSEHFLIFILISDVLLPSFGNFGSYLEEKDIVNWKATAMHASSGRFFG